MQSAEGAEKETPKVSRGGEWGLEGLGSIVSSPSGVRAEPRRKTILLLSKRVRTPLSATFVEN